MQEVNPPAPTEGGVLAIIPARGGSKGLPRKNVLPLGGKPLVAHSIETALRAASINRVVVTTDDDVIASIAAAYSGVDVVRRPADLATDRADLGNVLEHAQEMLAERNIFASHVAVLLPTHPFRTPGLVDFLTGKLLQGFSTVLTVRRITAAPWRNLVLNDGVLAQLKDEHGREIFFRSYGLFSGYTPGVASRCYCHEITNFAECVDIDEPSDFALAERVLADNLFSFGMD